MVRTPELCRRPHRCEIRGRGRRVQGRRSRSQATARRAALETEATNWTIASEGRTLRSARPGAPVSTADLNASVRVGRRARASGPPRLSAAREAPPRRSAAAPLLTKYGLIRQRRPVALAGGVSDMAARISALSARVAKLARFGRVAGVADDRNSRE